MTLLRGCWYQSLRALLSSVLVDVHRAFFVSWEKNDSFGIWHRRGVLLFASRRDASAAYGLYNMARSAANCRRVEGGRVNQVSLPLFTHFPQPVFSSLALQRHSHPTVCDSKIHRVFCGPAQSTRAMPGSFGTKHGVLLL